MSVTDWYWYALWLNGSTVSRMTIPMHHPGPREGFDEGSVEEMAQESYEVHIDVVERRPWGHSAHHDIEVPDDASALIEGFAAYGS